MSNTQSTEYDDDDMDESYDDETSPCPICGVYDYVVGFTDEPMCDILFMAHP